MILKHLKARIVENFKNGMVEEIDFLFAGHSRFINFLKKIGRP